MHWKTTTAGIRRLQNAGRVAVVGDTLAYVRFMDDFSVFPLTNAWTDTVGQNQFGGTKTYVVQTALPVVRRCILMTTDPGDLVLDPTCGSGTTAYVAEQWGRRWITIDTSRVALALARSRVMGARYPYYTLADSPEGQQAEAKLAGTEPKTAPTYNDIRHGFVYQRVPHITLKSIANNTEIDTIWEQRQPAVESARADLNRALDGHPIPFPVERGVRRGTSIALSLSLSPARGVTKTVSLRENFRNGRSRVRPRRTGPRRPARH